MSAAWDYIHVAKNRREYNLAELAYMGRRIKSAARRRAKGEFLQEAFVDSAFESTDYKDFSDVTRNAYKATFRFNGTNGGLAKF